MRYELVLLMEDSDMFPPLQNKVGIICVIANNEKLYKNWLADRRTDIFVNNMIDKGALGA